MSLPKIIQAGPEVALSTWTLARAVAEAGQLGVVSGTVLPAILARRLQLGDDDGHLRHAFEHFPFPGLARRVWEGFFVPGGKRVDDPFELTRQPTLDSGPALIELTILASFAEVFLAKTGHTGSIGIQFHGRVQLPLLPLLYGALLAGVDYVLVSGGNPRAVPAMLERLVHGEPAELSVSVAAGQVQEHLACGFDPSAFVDPRQVQLKQPQLLLSTASAEQAAATLLQTQGRVDGWIFATPGAELPTSSEYARLQSLGAPFWVGGRGADPARLAQALAQGAAGIEISTPFTFCEESALAGDLKQRLLVRCRRDAEDLDVDWTTSPTGAPVQVLRLEQTTADPLTFAQRERFCDVGHFRQPFRRTDGSIGYRCPGEPLDYYLQKGGVPAESAHQRCFCNGLLASLGLAQIQAGRAVEQALIPAGEEIRSLAQYLKPGQNSYTAAEVIDHLLGHAAQAAA
ncbi:MAG: nitronate monooxygenase [Verrucomicrobia bacterium]|nr:nitronate monooxygenase [Verrucomicrobiota bacterium]